MIDRSSTHTSVDSRRRAGVCAYGLAARLTVGLLMLAYTATSVSAATRSGYKVYTSTALHYRISYPSSWHLTSTQVYAVFESPSPRDGTVSVAAIAVPISSLDAYASILQKGKVKAGYKISSATKTHVAGADARLVTFVSRSGLKTSLVVFATTGKLWQVSYRAPAPRYMRNWNVFKLMLGSFSFT